MKKCSKCNAEIKENGQTVKVKGLLQIQYKTKAIQYDPSGEYCNLTCLHAFLKFICTDIKEDFKEKNDSES